MRAVTPDSRIELRALERLAAGFRGEVVRPGDGEYDEHRKIWNGSADKHPAVVLRCAGVDDVRRAVAFARESGMPVAVRGGGHSFPGHSTTDGVVIDLSPMRGIRVNPVSRKARAQAGVLLGELDQEAQAFGLAVPAGIVTHTGLAGLTLGGGIGWLMRKYGLTCDQLLSADVVTASSDFLTTSGDDELFWGLRGGGGNFGIVTEFEFALNPVGPEVYAGPVIWPVEDAPDLLRFYRDWIADAPDELTTAVSCRWIPAIPSIPEEFHGRPAVMVIACHCGPVVEGAKVLAPLKAFGTPLLDLCVPKPFLDHQAMFDPGFPRGRWYHTRSTDVAALTDDVIDVAVSCGKAVTGGLSSYIIFQLGGAMARMPGTAFAGRESGHTVNIVGATEGPEGFGEQRDWVRRSYDAFAPYGVGAYVNFLNDEGPERIRQAYGDERFSRLQALKREYDPDNLFRINQNIPPG